MHVCVYVCVYVCVCVCKCVCMCVCVYVCVYACVCVLLSETGVGVLQKSRYVTFFCALCCDRWEEFHCICPRKRVDNSGGPSGIAQPAATHFQCIEHYRVHEQPVVIAHSFQWLQHLRYEGRVGEVTLTLLERRHGQQELVLVEQSHPFAVVSYIQWINIEGVATGIVAQKHCLPNCCSEICAEAD